MNSERPPVGFRARGGWWVLAQFVLMLAVIILGAGYRGDWLPPGLVITVGAGLIALGGGFGISGMVTLGRNRTAYPRPVADGKLIQHGIYKRVRHPLYTSVMLIGLGWASLWQSWPGLVAAFALIPLLAAKARREEAWLREKYPGYADYARRVPRFLPWPSPARNNHL